jgi:hypothetical protein
MMIRPVSRDGIRGPGFRCHGSSMCSSRVIISCLHGRRARLRVESAFQCDGAVGLRFCRGAPASPGSLSRAAGRALLAAEHDLPDSSQYGDSSHPQCRMRAVQ